MIPCKRRKEKSNNTFINPKRMKKSVKETLKLAVDRLFIRIHGDLFETIYGEFGEPNFEITRIVYDSLNPAHRSLVNLCKEKIGYNPVATDQDIFYSILKVYVDAKRGNNRTNDKFRGTHYLSP